MVDHYLARGVHLPQRGFESSPHELGARFMLAGGFLVQAGPVEAGNLEGIFRCFRSACSYIVVAIVHRIRTTFDTSLACGR